MLEIDSLVDPGKKKVVEARRHAEERTEDDDSSEPDDDQPASIESTPKRPTITSSRAEEPVDHGYPNTSKGRA
jgi:hypothetical protein